MDALIVVGDEPVGLALQQQFACRGRPYRVLGAAEVGELCATAANGLVIDVASLPGVQTGAAPFADDAFRALVDVCRRRDQTLLMLSDSRVFAAERNKRYRESEVPEPLVAAGEALLARERYLAEWLPRHLILRSGPLIAATGTNLLTHLLAQIRRGEPLAVAAEPRFNLTPVADLARVVSGMLDQLDCGAPARGIFHYSGSETTSYYEFAEVTLAAAAQYWDVDAHRVQLQASAGEPWGGRFPLLSCSLIRDTFGIQQLPWRRAIPELVCQHLAAPA